MNARTLPSALAEKPMQGGAKFAMIACAALAITFFYLGALLLVTILLVLLAFEAVVALAAARFGAIGIVTPFIQRHLRLLMLVMRSAWLRSGSDFQVPLRPGEAPRLFAFLDDLSRRMRVPPPKTVLVEMNAGAWVRLRGVRRGADATTLGLGYDLIAGLTEREIEAVLAHEMAHAKFVRRGLKHLLNGGVARATKLTSELANLVGAYRAAKETFHLGEWLLGGADAYARLCVRLVAAYSRQDEFEADLGAAAICGSAPLRSALIKLEPLVAKTSRIAWSERVVQLQRGNGFSAWLTEELHAASSAAPSERAEEATDHYSTHPSLRDRLAALPPDVSAAPPSQPAIQLLADPDSLARRLVEEIQRVMLHEEARESRERLKWLGRIRRTANFSKRQMLGLMAALLGFIGTICVIFILDEFDFISALVSLGMVGGGTTLVLHGYRRLKVDIPIPDFAILSTATDDPKTRAEREDTLEAELRPLTAGRRKEAVARLRTCATEALSRCDYLRAYAAIRLWQDINGKATEPLLIGAIASAALGLDDQASRFVHLSAKATGPRGRSALWGCGWTLYLLGDWAAAEAMLLALQREGVLHPTVAMLLSRCQTERSKLQSAIAQARGALAASPGQPKILCLLINLLISAGYPREAEERLREHRTLAENDPDLAKAWIRLSLLQRDLETADRWLAQLRQKGLPGDQAVEIAGLYETARRDTEAEAYYREALASGFYPAAELGLARLALHRKDFAAARQHALAGIDTSRTPAEKAAPPLAFFTGALSVFLQAGKPIAGLVAWDVAVSSGAELGPFASRTFLVYAHGEDEAEQLVKTTIEATQPHKQPLGAHLFVGRRAPSDRQPAGNAVAGIQAI